MRPIMEGKMAAWFRAVWKAATVRYKADGAALCVFFGVFAKA